ncbi:hypothetical protein D9756_008533 [Leucocoprinus leucothites]|uniref:F-box domain-containing protein n=1 Tax=Leucocoprinus leucothites TaxID=201217 RepID=A0A8H5D0K6_9AGAR|nr:hypothetical protein D9756_008533 [Leucoagaricus leucothites]
MFSQYSLPTRTHTEAKQCLLCGSAQTTKFKYRSNLSGEGEACRLYHEVRDSEVLMEDVVPIQRVYLLRRYNAYSPATISKFPSEILVEIFEYAIQLSTFAHRHFSVVLSSVSSRWRELMHTTPFLWNCISIEFWNKSPKHLENRINLLRLYLRHSGTAALFVKVSYDHHALDGSQGSRLNTIFIDPTIDGTLTANLYRIRGLHLENASTRWLEYTPQLSSIESFRFKGKMSPYQGAPVISFAESHHLSELSLTDWSNINLGSGNLAHLTTIALESMEVTVCVSLLATCPNLVEYRCRSPKHPSVSSYFSYQPWNAVVTLKHLRVFEWEITEHDTLAPVEGAMFRYLHLPTLLSLRLYTRQYCRHPSVHLFCKHLPISLTRLHLSLHCGSEPEDTCLINSFPHDCDVRVLTLHSCGCLRSLEHVLKALEDIKRFPMLTHMVIDDKFKGRDRFGRQIELHAEFASLIHQMLIQRAKRAAFILGFFLKIVWFPVRWPTEVRRGLWELTHSGRFRLTIQEDMKPFNNLPHSYPPRYL